MLNFYASVFVLLQPSRVCNNNIPAHENTGERSSQYAAENSCRARYGPYSEWMASFDTGKLFLVLKQNIFFDKTGLVSVIHVFFLVCVFKMNT